MNEDQQTPNLEESISQVMRTLPPIIRDYLSAGKYTTVARNLTTKYGLRIDQAGVLEREIMLLLMGIETPQEFAQALTEEARLDKKIVDSIALDVNEQVFIPLRTEEQKIGMSKMSEPAIMPPKGITNLIKKDEPLTPLPPKPTKPARPSTTLGDVVRSVLLAPARLLDSRLLLEDHEEPSPSLKSIETPTPKPAEPPKTPSVIEKKDEQPQVFGSRIVPNSIPVNLPGTLPEVSMPTVSSQPEPSTPLSVETPKPAPLPSNRSYATDPYREPIDEDKG